MRNGINRVHKCSVFFSCMSFLFLIMSCGKTNPTNFQGNTTGTITDADGNIYTTVKIGNQTWTVENLRTTKLNDSTTIPLVADNDAWYYRATPACCWYGNDINNKNKYGALYNGYTVSTRKLAPAGWHVPSDAEWDTLEDYLITHGYNYDGTTERNEIAKALAAKTDWAISETEGAIGYDLTKNNMSGFTALPAGARGVRGEFSDLSNWSAWWSATDCLVSALYVRDLSFDFYNLFTDSNDKNIGYSVRLVKD